jgi:hypothetical protein
MRIEEFNRMPVPRQVRLSHKYKLQMCMIVAAFTLANLVGTLLILALHSSLVKASIPYLIMPLGISVLFGGVLVLIINSEVNLVRTGKIAEVYVDDVVARGRGGQYAKVRLPIASGEEIAYVPARGANVGDIIQIAYNPTKTSEVSRIDGRFEIFS